MLTLCTLISLPTWAGNILSASGYEIKVLEKEGIACIALEGKGFRPLPEGIGTTLKALFELRDTLYYLETCNIEKPDALENCLKYDKREIWKLAETAREYYFSPENNENRLIEAVRFVLEDLAGEEVKDSEAILNIQKYAEELRKYRENAGECFMPFYQARLEAFQKREGVPQHSLLKNEPEDKAAPARPLPSKKLEGWFDQ